MNTRNLLTELMILHYSLFYDYDGKFDSDYNFMI